MIAYLKGKVVYSQDSYAIVNTGSVGYQVFIGNSKLIQKGDEVEFFVHTIIREDGYSLWAFEKEEELSLFKLLLDVSGVGGKTAYTILDLLGVQQTIDAILSSDHKSLQVPGVGGKTAQKIILELKDKISKRIDLQKYRNLTGAKDNQNLEAAGQDEDAIEAMISLGYSKGDVLEARKQLIANEKEFEVYKSFKKEQDKIKVLLKYIR